MDSTFIKFCFLKLRFRFAGGAINSARSFVTSWLSELAQSTSEQNNEESDNNKEQDEGQQVTANSEENTAEL